MDEMNEWQPVRFLKLGKDCTKPTPRNVRRKRNLHGVVIRVREHFGPVSKNWICGSKRFFQVHPDDALEYWESKSGFLVTCEHRFQAD
jgi:hypothetical protein